MRASLRAATEGHCGARWCAQDYTRITFKPDFSKFKETRGLDRDMVALFKKRVYDIAGTARG
jgi:hypothetical protein